MYVNKQHGIRKIISNLSEQGYKNRNGNNFEYKFISRVLQNEVYVGCIVYGKSRYEYVENDDLSKKVQKTIKVGKEDWVVAENAR